MSAINLGDDDGFITMELLGAEIQLDLYATSNMLRDFHQAHKDAPDHDYNEGIVELMTSLGLPRCSHRMAARFVKAINDAVVAVKKKDGTTQGSPASTTSTPSV